MSTPLCLRPALWLLFTCLCPEIQADAPAPAATEETTILPKLEVKGHALCSYGIGIIATWNEKTQRISHLYVDAVAPHSQADQIGLKRSDEILSLNGRKIADLKRGTKSGSDLFVNQPVGQMIDVEVVVHVVKRIVLAATP